MGGGPSKTVVYNHGTTDQDGPTQAGYINSNFFFGSSWTDENGVEHHHASLMSLTIGKVVVSIFVVLLVLLILTSLLGTFCVTCLNHCHRNYVPQTEQPPSQPSYIEAMARKYMQ